MAFEKTLTPAQALQKVKHYCAYQERSHREVKEKLYGYGLYKKDVDIILAQLIEENYLNEERYAIAYAGGKFRMKYWGKVKIKYELKQKGVSDYCIKKAISSIEEEVYTAMLKKLAEEKWRSLKGEKNIFIKMKKTQSFLLQKGFESSLVNEAVERCR